MKKYSPKDCVLGVMVTSRAVHAVLLSSGPEGPEIVRRFRRQRNAHGAYQDLGGAGDPGYGNVDEGADDFTIEFGDGGGPDLFMNSEFGGLETPTGGDFSVEDKSEGLGSFELELEDILAECSNIGYPDPLIAFCVDPAELTTLEVRLGVEAKKKTDKEGKTVHDRGQILDVLKREYDGDVEDERVAFLPVQATEEEGGRYLALLPKGNDAVFQTLTALRENRNGLPTARIMDAELSLYIGLARTSAYITGRDEEASMAGAMQKTLIVRAGLEDTLVIFLSDGVLQHYESLRSITSYDAPETICSRVLLLQDEYGVGDVEQVLLYGDEREEALVESFELFFPDTRVESIRLYLPKADIDEEGEMAARPTVLATIVGLRLMDDALYQSAFLDINMLPSRLLRRQFRMPVSWHVLGLYVALFVTVLFFVGKFFSQSHELDLYRYKLQEYPSDVTNANPQVLQARIDSLKQTYEGYMRALNVLDSLLVGSDMWSRSLEKTSNEANKVKGIWIESWRPKGRRVELIGNATGRDHVVNFADRVDGSIESLTFSEIRSWPVYSFRMTVPLPYDLPEAARYLRKQVAIEAGETVPGKSSSRGS